MGTFFLQTVMAAEKSGYDDLITDAYLYFLDNCWSGGDRSRPVDRNRVNFLAAIETDWANSNVSCSLGGVRVEMPARRINPNFRWLCTRSIDTQPEVLAQRQRPRNNVLCGYKVAPTTLMFIDLDSKCRSTRAELISPLNTEERHAFADTLGHEHQNSLPAQSPDLALHCRCSLPTGTRFLTPPPR